MNYFYLLFFSIFGFTDIYSQSSLNSLVIGSKAPPIEVIKWVKGRPVFEFEKETTYIVEFGCTWCKPCIESIPYLTEISKKYCDNVVVIGVFIWENDTTSASIDYIKNVERLVTSMGDKIDFRIGVDKPNWTMAISWMNAAGKRGIPTAFVVDRKGIIVWIGHPMDLEQSIKEVLK